LNRRFLVGRTRLWVVLASVVGLLGFASGVFAFVYLSRGSGAAPKAQNPAVSRPAQSGSAVPVSGGLLTGEPGLVSSDVDLSVQGKLDWVHWGYLTSDDTGTNVEFLGNPVQVDCQPMNRCVNRKRGGAPGIGDFIPVGDVDLTAPFRLYRRAGTRFSWSDGSPVRSAAGARTVFYVAVAGNGYRIQAPADQTVHQFTLYMDLWQAKVQCVASLSDRSAPDYVDASLSPDKSPTNSSYTFTYRAARPGQTLTVTLTIVEDWGGGNVAVSAAALS